MLGLILVGNKLRIVISGLGDRQRGPAVVIEGGFIYTKLGRMMRSWDTFEKDRRMYER